jgi:tripartite-type tricarboxylate transporter receptor subunit TctC
MKNPLTEMLLIGPALSLLLAAGAASVSAADAYPTKPVRLIIPFTTGAAVDVVGRIIAIKLTDRLGKQFIVDNRGGAGGTIGPALAAKAAPDGYTFLAIGAGYVTSPALHKELPYDPAKAFVPVAKLASGPSLLVVHPGVPAQSVKEFIALAKDKPGQLLLTSSGVGSYQHLTAELFRIKAGINLNIIQFTGGGAMMADLVGGHSHGTISTGAIVLPHIRSGKLRALGVGSMRRSAILPDIPTIAETVPGYESGGWWGILAPAGTPKPIIDRINKELQVIVPSDDLKKIFANDAAEADYQGPAEFGPFLLRQIAQWKQVVKEANLKLE